MRSLFAFCVVGVAVVPQLARGAVGDRFSCDVRIVDPAGRPVFAQVVERESVRVSQIGPVVTPPPYNVTDVTWASVGDSGC